MALDVGFPDALHAAAQALGAPDSWLLLVFYLESRLDPTAHRPGSNFYGLSQLNASDVTKYSGGLSPQAYLALPASGQVPIIAAWYRDALAGKSLPSPGAFYSVNLAPANVGDGSAGTVLYKSPSAAYQGNAGLDVNKDGAITIGDLDAFMFKLAKEPAYQTALGTLVDPTPPYGDSPPADPTTNEASLGRALQAGLLGLAVAGAATIGIAELVRTRRAVGARRSVAYAPRARRAQANPAHAKRDATIALGAVAVLAGAGAYLLARRTATNAPQVPSGTTGLRVFPIADVPGANIHFTDDFGMPRSGGRKHQGNDLFATQGTPILAPDDGVVTFTDDGQPGPPGAPPPLSFHMTGDSDGTFYFGTHLKSFTGGQLGDSIHVVAGQQIGTVGIGGNAQGTPPHLHFEVHPKGSGAIDPYPLLLRATRLGEPITLPAISVVSNASALPADDGMYVKGLLGPTPTRT